MAGYLRAGAELRSLDPRGLGLLVPRTWRSIVTATCPGPRPRPEESSAHSERLQQGTGISKAKGTSFIYLIQTIV